MHPKDKTYLLRHRTSQRIKRVRDSAHSRTVLSLTTYSILPVFLFNFGSVNAAPVVSNPDYKPSLIQPVALIKPLAPVATPPAPAPIQPPVVPPPAPVEAPVAPAPIAGPVVGCGDNMYKQYIYQHEGGCNSCMINGGLVDCNYQGDLACGIGQAWPCSKLRAVCSLSDWACEDQFFTNYANSVYGGWYGSYLHWLSNRNW